MAGSDTFLKIDGIEGESLDSTHKSEIEILGWSWGATNSGTFSEGAGGGAGKVTMQDFHFSAYYDKCAPKLLLACSKGTHVPKAVLSARKAGDGQKDYLTITFTEFMVTSVQIAASGSGDIRPTAEFTLNFSKVEYTYKPQDGKGALGSEIKAGYDLKANKAT